MRFFLVSLFITLYASIVAATPGQMGFSVGVVNPDGSAKTTADFLKDFAIIKPYSNIVRIYSAANTTLTQILPAVKQANFKIIVGVWPANGTADQQFITESASLKANLQGIDPSIIYAVTVGSEALYRGDMSPAELVKCITSIKTLLKGINLGSVKVGTADSWNLWVNGANVDVIRACDIVLSNAFSYWQGQDIATNATHSFMDDIMQALAQVQSINAGAEFWVGETGWPTAGANFGSAIPSIPNARTFWYEGACALREWGVNVFIFEAFDETWKPMTSGKDVETHWGVWDSARAAKYNLTC